MKPKTLPEGWTAVPKESYRTKTGKKEWKIKYKKRR